MTRIWVVLTLQHPNAGEEQDSHEQDTSSLPKHNQIVLPLDITIDANRFELLRHSRP